MKSTGIVRPIDSLGRVVLPMELRNTMNISSQDRLYEYEKYNKPINGDYEILSKISRIDLDDVFSLSHLNNDYLKWRKYFYGD